MSVRAVAAFEQCQFANDLDLAQKLVENVPGLQFDVAAHEQEHGIEVQLPILERVAPNLKVVGLAISWWHMVRDRIGSRVASQRDSIIG